jgi:hypothetical protein
MARLSMFLRNQKASRRKSSQRFCSPGRRRWPLKVETLEDRVRPERPIARHPIAESRKRGLPQIMKVLQRVRFSFDSRRWSLIVGERALD